MDTQTWGAFLPVLLIGGALIGSIIDVVVGSKMTTSYKQRHKPAVTEKMI